MREEYDPILTILPANIYHICLKYLINQPWANIVDQCHRMQDLIMVYTVCQPSSSFKHLNRYLSKMYLFNVNTQGKFRYSFILLLAVKSVYIWWK